jgi:hypothetical protein
MLSQDDLTTALKLGQAAGDTCGHWCRVGAAIEDGTAYRIHHNGTGSRDTDDQVVYATAPLAMTIEQLGARIGTWITGVHRGEKINLNAS